MPLWGASNTSTSQPKWLANNAQPWYDMFQRYGEVYAAQDGWVQVLPSRAGTVKTEILVAMGSLNSRLGPPMVPLYWFENPLTANGLNTTVMTPNTTYLLNVAYNQQVNIQGTQQPLLNIQCTGSLTANITANYASGNGTSILSFAFTTPKDFQGNANANVVMTLVGQPINCATGNIVATLNTSVNANTWLPTAANTGFPFTGRTPTLIVQQPVAQILSIGLGATTTRNAASNIYVNFSTPVNVLTAAVPTLGLNVAVGNTSTATYASGNGTSNLRFTWTVGQFVANLTTIAANTTIKTAVLNDTTSNAAANLFITSAVATAAGTVTPT